MVKAVINKEKEKIKELQNELEFVKAKHPIFRSPRTAGQKAADYLTKWAGSWIFIFGFLPVCLWLFED